MIYTGLVTRITGGPWRPPWWRPWRPWWPWWWPLAATLLQERLVAHRGVDALRLVEQLPPLGGGQQQGLVGHHEATLLL